MSHPSLLSAASRRCFAAGTDDAQVDVTAPPATNMRGLPPAVKTDTEVVPAGPISKRRTARRARIRGRPDPLRCRRGAVTGPARKSSSTRSLRPSRQKSSSRNGRRGRRLSRCARGPTAPGIPVTTHIPAPRRARPAAVSASSPGDAPRSAGSSDSSDRGSAARRRSLNSHPRGRTLAARDRHHRAGDRRLRDEGMTSAARIPPTSCSRARRRNYDAACACIDQRDPAEDPPFRRGDQHDPRPADLRPRGSWQRFESPERASPIPTR